MSGISDPANEQACSTRQQCAVSTPTPLRPNTRGDAQAGRSVADAVVVVAAYQRHGDCGVASDSVTLRRAMNHIASCAGQPGATGVFLS